MEIPIEDYNEDNDLDWQNIDEENDNQDDKVWGNYDTDGFMIVRQTQPLPLTILSLYPRLVTNDG